MTTPTNCPALPATVYAYGHAAWFRSTRDQCCKVLPMIRVAVCEAA